MCHHFGRGRFTDFPVELLKMIGGYAVDPVRREVAKELEATSRVSDVAICGDSPYLEELDESPEHEKNRI